MLVISWKMEAKQMGYFHIKEWLKGMNEMQSVLHYFSVSNSIIIYKLFCFIEDVIQH